MILPAARHYKSQVVVLLALLPLLIMKLILRGGVLYHVERDPLAYLERVENPAMIERQYGDDPSEFYTRLKAFWTLYGQK